MASLPMGSLAAHISMAPVAGATGPSTVLIMGAPLLAGPSAPPPAASTSMDVNYGSPLTDPLSEGNENNASSCHGCTCQHVTNLVTFLVGLTRGFHPVGEGVSSINILLITFATCIGFLTFLLHLLVFYQ